MNYLSTVRVNRRTVFDGESCDKVDLIKRTRKYAKRLKRRQKSLICSLAFSLEQQAPQLLKKVGDILRLTKLLTGLVLAQTGFLLLVSACI